MTTKSENKEDRHPGSFQGAPHGAETKLSPDKTNQETGRPEGEVTNGLHPDETPQFDSGGVASREFDELKTREDIIQKVMIDEARRSLLPQYFSGKADADLSTREPMARADQMYALFGMNRDLERWNSETAKACKDMTEISDKFHIEVRPGGHLRHSLGLSYIETTVNPGHQGMVARIPIIEAILGKHTEESLDHALDLCIRMRPDALGRVDLLPLHGFLEIPESFTLWRARTFRDEKMKLGRDYFRSSSGGYLVSDIVAQLLATGICTRRGLKLRMFFIRFQELTEPDPDKHWQTMLEALRSESESPNQHITKQD